jgi:uncharacterized protein (TIGR00255 family)
MTAYGRGECDLEDVRFVAEIRSFNNRHRDIIFRIPRNYQIFEEELRATVLSRIKRGRVEISIQIEGNDEKASYELELNKPLVKSYLDIVKELSEKYKIGGEVSAETVLQQKDMVLIKPEELELEKMKAGFMESLNSSLDSHEVMRINEGKNIEEDFLKRLQLLEKYTEEIKIRIPAIVDEYRLRLKDRVQSMTEDFEVDENRLAQEVAYFSDRSDITEEIVRLRSHLKQFRDYLSIDDAKGRRLDFLIQEINREVNTTSSKASDSMVSKIVVEMKAELEKLREQVQNVE